MEGVLLAGGETIEADHVVLAVGHSARDTFKMLHEEGVFIEAKPFSIGCRIEHPQSVIDRARLGPNAGNRLLGPMAGPSIVSACARAGRWWRRHRSPVGWSPTE